MTLRRYAALLFLPLSAVAQAQVIETAREAEQSTAAAAVTTPSRIAVPDPGTIEMPQLDFTPTARDAGDYEKYFFFHRADTDFEQAYADITECDALASGISYYSGGGEPYPGYYATQYGIGGAIGGVLGSVLADAIHGSALRRKVRRINMRNCMGFKGYQRYGLSKELWVEFNFEEGNGRKRDDVREAALLKQAKAASGPQPTAKAIAL